IEELVDANEKRLYRVAKFIHRARSKYQTIDVVSLVNHGRTLLLDGVPRVFESDEYIYHEALIHPLIALSSTTPRNVLVIGDGDGGGIREILKYADIERLHWVEIDEQVVEVCREHLGCLPRPMYDDPRLTIHIMDGVDYVRRTEEVFDAVYLSGTEIGTVECADRLFLGELYDQVGRILSDSGLVVQSMAPVTPALVEPFAERVSRLSQHFCEVLPYRVGLPAFGIDWGFAVATAQAGGFVAPKVPTVDTQFYDLAAHRAMFCLPKYMS
ncbi:hypothetical protein LCGC14_2945840, partial [marine sediment metagenome]